MDRYIINIVSRLHFANDKRVVYTEYCNQHYAILSETNDIWLLPQLSFSGVLQLRFKNESYFSLKMAIFAREEWPFKGNIGQGQKLIFPYALKLWVDFDAWFKAQN